MVETFPDHDFNNVWGSILGVSELQSRPIADSLLKQYWNDPVKLSRKYGRIMSQYIDKFENFFAGTLPISFRGHVTDAMCPSTVTSLLLRLAIIASSDSPDSIHASGSVERAELASMLGWNARHLESPRWAVVEDSFAAGFGPLVSRPGANLSAQPAFRAHAAGTSSIRVILGNRPQADLSKALLNAKQLGCIGVIVEIVNNQLHGRVTTPEQLRNLSGACRETGLMLVIDETVTAIRCGAPFAHQRAEYQDICKPDLVFFGKGLRANGIGINFDAPYIKRLGIHAAKKKRQAIYDWQAVVTQALPPPMLIEALGVLEMAATGNWVGRATIIGQQLRKIVMRRAESVNEDDATSGNPVLGGIDSFIFVRKDIAATFLVMGASNAGPWVRWVRWMPRMDHHLLDNSIVESIMSAKGRGLRQGLSRSLEREGLKPQWCFYCGNTAGHDGGPRWCRTCCVDVCSEVECIQNLLTHMCLDSHVANSFPGSKL